jgi:hypothetical protein
MLSDVGCSHNGREFLLYTHHATGESSCAAPSLGAVRTVLSDRERCSTRSGAACCDPCDLLLLSARRSVPGALPAETASDWAAGEAAAAA